MSTGEATVSEVKEFWNSKPLMSLELEATPGSKEFFEHHHLLKVGETERFAYDFWEFDKHAKGDRVLDVGCGPGWLVRQFAQNGTDITGIDISDVSIDIARKGLEVYGLQGTLKVGNAEELPFEDDSFDYITSSGVLHHTPDTKRAFLEVYRVLKPGKTAAISLYYKNALLRPPLYTLTRIVFNALGGKLPGRDKMNSARSADEFIRIYDGDENPVGKGYTLAEAKELVKPFEFVHSELHYFPSRFIPGFSKMPVSAHKFLDSRFGTMIYMKLRKPA